MPSESLALTRPGVIMLLLIGGCITHSRPIPADAQKSGWVLTFHDEFDGSFIDTNRWNTNYRNSPKLRAYYAVENGVLHLMIGQDKPRPRGDGGGRVSGIETRNHWDNFAQQYGRFEIR